MPKTYRSRPGFQPNESIEDYLERMHRITAFRLSKPLTNFEWSPSRGWQDSYDVDEDERHEARLLKQIEGEVWHKYDR